MVIVKLLYNNIKIIVTHTCW